jgi:hypothetical protein
MAVDLERLHGELRELSTPNIGGSFDAAMKELNNPELSNKWCWGTDWEDCVPTPIFDVWEQLSVETRYVAWAIAEAAANGIMTNFRTPS